MTDLTVARPTRKVGLDAVPLCRTQGGMEPVPVAWAEAAEVTAIPAAD